MNDLRFAVAFRVSHPTADLCATAVSLATRLGVAPTILWTAGTPRRSLGPRVLPGVHAEFACTFECPHDHDARLPCVLADCLRRLAPVREALREIVRTGGRLGFFVGLFADGNAGEALDRDLLCQLGDWRIDLELDVYGAALATRGQA